MENKIGTNINQQTNNMLKHSSQYESFSSTKKIIDLSIEEFKTLVSLFVQGQHWKSLRIVDMEKIKFVEMRILLYLTVPLNPSQNIAFQ